MLKSEATKKAEIINTVEYLNSEYKEDQLVNIARSRESK